MKNYSEQQDIKNTIRLRNMVKTLPSFCTTFFIGIESSTTSTTRIGYAYDLQTFFSYILITNPLYKNKRAIDIPISILDELRASDIEEYLQYLNYYQIDEVHYTNKENGKSRKIASLNSLYLYLLKRELIFTNPVALITRPKLHEKTPIVLDPNETVKLLDSVEHGLGLTPRELKFHVFTVERDVAIITLLLGTGLRVSECVGLDLPDVDFDNNRVHIIRKGRNEANVYFNEEVRQALLSYIEIGRPKLTSDTDEYALFVSLRGKRMAVRSIEAMVSKFAARYLPSKNITPHKFRSTCGTSLYQASGDIYLVADVLGHKDVNTTKKHYAAMSQEKRIAAASYITLRERPTQ